MQWNRLAGENFLHFIRLIWVGTLIGMNLLHLREQIIFDVNTCTNLGPTSNDTKIMCRSVLSMT